MVKKAVVHLDIIGNPILLSSKLAVARHNELVICSVTQITPKMLRVATVRGSDTYLIHPEQAVVLDGQSLLVYLLKSK